MKEDNEGIPFHTLLTTGTPRGDRISRRKMRQPFRSSVFWVACTYFCSGQLVWGKGAIGGERTAGPACRGARRKGKGGAAGGRARRWDAGSRCAGARARTGTGAAALGRGSGDGAPGFLGARQGGLGSGSRRERRGRWATVAHRGGGAGPMDVLRTSTSWGKCRAHAGTRGRQGDGCGAGGKGVGFRRMEEKNGRDSGRRRAGRFYMGAGLGHREKTVCRRSRSERGSTRGFLKSKTAWLGVIDTPRKRDRRAAPGLDRAWLVGLRGRGFSEQGSDARPRGSVIGRNRFG
jgi:hypothetical protein